MLNQKNLIDSVKQGKNNSHRLFGILKENKK